MKLLYSLSVARTKFLNSTKVSLLHDTPLHLAKWLHTFTHVFVLQLLSSNWAESGTVFAVAGLNHSEDSVS